MNCIQINYVAFFLFNSSFELQFNLLETCNNLQVASGLISLQSQRDFPLVTIEVTSQFFQLGDNKLYFTLAPNQFYYFQSASLFLFSPLDNTSYSSNFNVSKYYDKKGIFNITMLQIQPTISIRIQLSFFGLSGFTLSRILVGDVQLDNTICVGFGTITSLVDITCNLVAASFQISQALQHLLNFPFIPILITATKDKLIFEDSIKSQLISDQTGNCLSNPIFLITNQNLQVLVDTQPTFKCKEQVKSAYVQINITGTLDIITISNTFYSFKPFTIDNQVSFFFSLSREQSLVLTSLQQFLTTTLLINYNFPFEQQQFYQVINIQNITEASLLFYTMKFNKQKIQIVYENGLLIQLAKEISVMLFFNSSQDPYIFLNQSASLYRTNVLTFKQENIHLKYSTTQQYINNIDMKIINNKILSATSLLVGINGAGGVNVVSTIINLNQYLNTDLLILILFIAIIQLLFCLLYFAINKNSYLYIRN
ncbi:Transmembrane domain-containing protein [Spironucleus salmonicida]|uniref:Transmembrane domain-containing protein n=1 Tax=Spironucleus salmonicida TaxID=348837 RepID=V6LI06_9EUKA|nr:Transmembrane domain-containing protein [Spironucleus salmonicida]|eukprot:EST43953.1 Transmembrane domain-containing protein [Spironucleus salmonicida]